ncbi:MAG: hypothetical protein HC901_01925 [Bdellovibrionaceae bacterium]|nr:hypothetical protein [Pseudobdellovibrionaceae bacterium]
MEATQRLSKFTLGSADDRAAWGEVDNEQLMRLRAQQAQANMLREIQPKWVGAANVAKQWQQSREMPKPINDWLSLLQDATTEFTPATIKAFRTKMRDLEDGWSSIQLFYSNEHPY